MRSKKTSGIYKIENIINNKVYVGSSVSIEDRWIRHKTDLVKGKSCSIKLQNSYNKHGVENFEFSILEECRIDNLIEREQYYINMYNSYNEGYNCCAIAGNTLGFSPSEETRNKIRISVSGDKNPFYGKKHTEESRAIMRESHKGQISSFKGRHHTEESKIKMIESRKDRWEETKKKISDSSKGKLHSEETKKKIGESGKGKVHSDETKAKISASNKGKIVSEESKKKISESKKGKNHSEETCKLLSKLRKGRNSSRYNPTPVIQYSLDYKFIKEWKDLFELTENGFRSSNVSRACKSNGISYGFRWKFKNN